MEPSCQVTQENEKKWQASQRKDRTQGTCAFWRAQKKEEAVLQGSKMSLLGDVKIHLKKKTINMHDVL